MTLTDEQETEMLKAVERYGMTLEQACWYGFFNFEFRLDPSSGDDCWAMIHQIIEAKDQQKSFENRFEADYPSWLEDGEGADQNVHKTEVENFPRVAV